MFFRKSDKQKKTNLRQTMTKSEKYLWQELRKKQRDGFRFRRQFSVVGFVVDFYCMSEKLAIEVDGSYHKNTEEYDKERQQILEGIGLNFLRFSNEEVLNNWNLVNLKIEKKLHELRSRRDGGAVDPP